VGWTHSQQAPQGMLCHVKRDNCEQTMLSGARSRAQGPLLRNTGRTLDVEHDSLHSRPLTRCASRCAASAAASGSGSRPSGKLRSRNTLAPASRPLLEPVNCFRYCANAGSMMPAAPMLFNLQGVLYRICFKKPRFKWPLANNRRC